MKNKMFGGERGFVSLQVHFNDELRQQNVINETRVITLDANVITRDGRFRVIKLRSRGQNVKRGRTRNEKFRKMKTLGETEQIWVVYRGILYPQMFSDGCRNPTTCSAKMSDG